MGFGAGLGVWNAGYWFARKHGAEAPQLGALSIASNVLMAASATAAPAVSAKLGSALAVAALRAASAPLLAATALSSSLAWASALYVLRSALVNAADRW